MLSAEEAEKAGLVSRVVPVGTELDAAVAVAEKIAGFSTPVAQLDCDWVMDRTTFWLKSKLGFPLKPLK